MSRESTRRAGIQAAVVSKVQAVTGLSGEDKRGGIADCEKFDKVSERVS
jgi:hypothetical protein